MVEKEHDWHSREYAERWAAKDDREAVRREPQFQATIKWLSVFLGAQARVLELGSGPGALTRRLLAAFPEMRVICLDASRAMLDVARERLASFGDRVSFVQADFSQSQWATDLPRDLDAVVTARAVHNLRKLRPIEMVYRQVNELLRPGGLFLNIERVNFSTPRLRSYYKELQVRDTGGHPRIDGFAPSLGQQFHLLKRAGFVDVDCLWRESNTAIVAGFKEGATSS